MSFINNNNNVLSYCTILCSVVVLLLVKNLPKTRNTRSLSSATMDSQQCMLLKLLSNGIQKNAALLVL